MNLSRSRIKLLLRLGLMGVVGVFGIVALGFLSRAMADITRSEETADIFNVSAKLHYDLIEAVEWLPDPAGLPKEMPPLVREDITETWLRAWAQLLILSDGQGPVGSSLEGEATDGIAEYFDGSAADAMLAGADDWLGLPVHQIGHDLRLNFYSDDGSVVSVTSVSSRFLRGQPVGDTIEWYDSDERYDVVFVLQNGNWRIHHWVRQAADGAWATELDGGRPIPFEAEDLRAVTWRPSNQSIEQFLAEPDFANAQAELAVLGDLGFNTVRIEVPFDELGGRDVDAADLFPIAVVMDLADEAGLDVIASLLTGRTEHQPLHWDADDDHLETVVDVLRDHPALVLWELSAQPDLHLGIERVEQPMLDAWLTHVGRTLKRLDDDTPMTIGWSTARAAAEAPPIADVVSFVWNGDQPTVEADLPVLREVAGDRPIIIADAAYHTHLGILPGGHTETEQARWFADMLLAVEALELDGFSVSMLRDLDVETVAAEAQAEAERLDAEEKAAAAERDARFPAPPTPEPKERGPEVHEAPVVAEVTWPVGGDAETGLIRVDGTAKPAAAVFAPGADLDAVPAPSPIETVRKPFNMIVLFLLGAGLGTWLFLWLWASNRLPVPHIRRRRADGNDAQQRRRRKRKKVSVTAPIDPQTSSDAPAKAGMFRRVVDWLNAPVLPENDEAAPAVAETPVNGAEHPVVPAATVGVPVTTIEPASAMPVVEPALTTPAIGVPAANGLEPSATGLALGHAAPDPTATMTPPAAATHATAIDPVAIGLVGQQQALAAEFAAKREAAAQELALQQAAAAQAAHELAAQQAAIEALAAERAAAEQQLSAAQQQLIAQQVAPPAPLAQPPVSQAPAAAPPQPAVQPPVAQPAIVQPQAAPQPPTTEPAQPSPIASEADVAARDARFQAWLTQQQRPHEQAGPETPTDVSHPEMPPAVAAPADPIATAPIVPATNGHAVANGHDVVEPPAEAPPVTQPASDALPEAVAPAETLADALPSWPNDDMTYDDVHEALFGPHDRTAPPAPTAMAMIEVDLQPIDAVIEASGKPVAGSGALRYAPFLMRALCMVAAEHAPTGDRTVHITVGGTDVAERHISNAQDMRLPALTRELASVDSGGEHPSATVAIDLSNAAGGLLNVEIGNGAIPTVSLVYLNKRPIATRDALGCTAITTHSLGLLSVAAATTPTRADAWLEHLRHTLETRDWSTELD